MFLSDESKQLPPPPPHLPHDLWPVISFILETLPDQERARGQGAGLCRKRADVSAGFWFDRRKYRYI